MIHPKLLLANARVLYDRTDLTRVIERLQDAVQGLTRARVRRDDEVNLGVADICLQLLAGRNSLRLALRRKPQRSVWLGFVDVKIHIALALSVPD